MYNALAKEKFQLCNMKYYGKRKIVSGKRAKKFFKINILDEKGYGIYKKKKLRTEDDKMITVHVISNTTSAPGSPVT